jgi:hypothetical protein
VREKEKEKEKESLPSAAYFARGRTWLTVVQANCVQTIVPNQSRRLRELASEINLTVRSSHRTNKQTNKQTNNNNIRRNYTE